MCLINLAIDILTAHVHLKPRLHDTPTTGCQTRWTTGWMFVYTIHRVVNRLSNRFDNRLDNRLYRVNGVLMHKD